MVAAYTTSQSEQQKRAVELNCNSCYLDLLKSIKDKQLSTCHVLRVKKNMFIYMVCNKVNLI